MQIYARIYQVKVFAYILKKSVYIYHRNIYVYIYAAKKNMHARAKMQSKWEGGRKGKRREETA